MTKPWLGGQEPTDQLPNAELNPLLNPTLGENLGRWAQVYFTSPPEKREEAVGELLRELQDETPKIPGPKIPGIENRTASEAPRMAVTEAPSAEKPAGGLKSQPQVLCPACQYVSDVNQKFCGNCGSPLHAGSMPDAHRSDQVFARNQASTRGGPVHAEPVHVESDVRWLREKAVLSWDEAEGTAHRGWKYLIVGFAVLLAGFTYLQWASLQPHRPPASPPSAAAPPSTMPQPQLQSEKPALAAGDQNQWEQVQTARKTATVENTVATQANIDKKPVEVGLGSAAPNFSSATGSASFSSPQAAGGGTQELLLAQRYLEGKTGSRDSSEAAKWLWKAVGKQNADASLLLADLYMRGDGISKSCDQARLLLVAAAKKGATQAAQRLRSLESNGCR